MSKQVFISYSRNDVGTKYSEEIQDFLDRQGFKVWRDVRSINNYADFSVEIERGIETSDVIVVVLTPDIKDSVKSFVRREIYYADAIRKPLLVLKMPEYDRVLPIVVNHLTYIDFSASFDVGLHELAEVLLGDLRYIPLKVLDDPYHSYVVKLRDYVIEQLRKSIPVGDQLIHIDHMADGGLTDKPASIEYEYDDEESWLNGYERQRQAHANDTILDVLSNDTYQQRVLVVGEPGAGKTTLLLAFTRELVNRRLADSLAILPLFVPIRMWKLGESLVNFLARVTER